MTKPEQPEPDFQKQAMPHSDEWVLMGQIGAAHGIRGEVKILSYARPRENILSFAAWGLVSAASAKQPSGTVPRLVAIKRGRVQGKALVAQLDGVSDRNAAEALRGTQIWVQAAALPELAEDEMYWHDLPGMQVVNTEGIVLGKVDHLLETGANDVIVVRASGDGSADEVTERVLPWIDDVIIEVDVEQRQILVDWDADF